MGAKGVHDRLMYLCHLYWENKERKEPHYNPDGLHLDCTALLHTVFAFFEKMQKEKNEAKEKNNETKEQKNENETEEQEDEAKAQDNESKVVKMSRDDAIKFLATRLLWTTEHQLNLIQPKKRVHMFFDGVPIKAKLPLQMDRREGFHHNADVLGKTLENDVLKVEISPGTAFMSQLVNLFLINVSQRIKEGHKHWKGLQVSVSDTNEEGEAEQKSVLSIIQWPSPTGSIAMYGQDSDCKILALLTHKEDMSLYEFTRAKKIKWTVMSELREFIIEDLMMKKKICGEHERKQVINDFVLITFFMKNDCLPERACVKLELQDFVDCYVSVGCPLTKFDKIIPENLAKFIQEVARIEKKKLRDDVHDTAAGHILFKSGGLNIPQRHSTSNARRKEAAALKKADPKFKEQEKQRILEQKKSVIIDDGTLMYAVETKKRVHYASKGYDTPEKVSRLVVNYLNLLASYWEHVLTGKSSCRWTYCVPIAPYFSDMLGSIEFEDCTKSVCIRPLPLEHLCSVLPSQCISLLPKIYQLSMTESINIETDLDEMIIKFRELNPNQYLTEEELQRNRKSFPLVFPNGNQDLRPWRAPCEKGDEKFGEVFKDDELAKPFRFCLPAPQMWEVPDGIEGQSRIAGLCPSFDIDKYLSYFPISIYHMISRVHNVGRDGNCGFRAVANAVKGDEQQWQQVRQELYDEMVGNKVHYIDLLGGLEIEYQYLLNGLQHSEGGCGWDMWFDMQLGWAVSNYYNIAFTIVSEETRKLGNRTYFPTRRTSMPMQHVWLGFDGSHFVQLFMNGSCAMPKVNANWHTYSVPEAKELFKTFKKSTKEDDGKLYRGSYDESSL